MLYSVSFSETRAFKEIVKVYELIFESVFLCN